MSALEPGADLPRIGIGWDRHRLQPGRRCVLGGMQIDSPVGPAGHSDGDALLHALTDALLGAAGFDDLGTLFPDTDPRWKDAPSATFLDAALAKLDELRLRPVSVDCVLVCDRPRLAPHREALRTHLARRLRLPQDRVNLKGKTTEGVGGEESIEATVVVLLAGTAPLSP